MSSGVSGLPSSVISPAAEAPSSRAISAAVAVAEPSSAGRRSRGDPPSKRGSV